MGCDHKLTIAIPTYNRANKLKETLPNTLALCKGKPIEIIVSDNCSADGTEEYVQSILKDHPTMRYYRNSENIGADANFLSCLEKAQGEYVLLLGDDDVLLEKGLLSLLSAIDEKPVFIFMNSLKKKKSKEDKLFIKYHDKDAFLEKMGIFITFMSALVFRTENVREIQEKEQYIGTCFLQSHLALRTMAHEGEYIYVPDCCCHSGGNYTVPYDLLYVWGKCFGDLLFHTALESGFGEKSIWKVAHEAYKKKIFSFVIFYRGTCRQEAEWDRDAMWMYVNKFPDLIRRYKFALSCPASILAIMRLDAVWHVIKNFFVSAKAICCKNM